jgi:hypothetical protein
MVADFSVESYRSETSVDSYSQTLWGLQLCHVPTRWNETIKSVWLQKKYIALFNTCPSVLPQSIVNIFIVVWCYTGCSTKSVLSLESLYEHFWVKNATSIYVDCRPFYLNENFTYFNGCKLNFATRAFFLTVQRKFKLIWQKKPQKKTIPQSLTYLKHTSCNTTRKVAIQILYEVQH